jgi:hypothetical protein
MSGVAGYLFRVVIKPIDVELVEAAGSRTSGRLRLRIGILQILSKRPAGRRSASLAPTIFGSGAAGARWSKSFIYREIRGP